MSHDVRTSTSHVQHQSRSSEVRRAPPEGHGSVNRRALFENSVLQAQDIVRTNNTKREDHTQYLDDLS